MQALSGPCESAVHVSAALNVSSVAGCAAECRKGGSCVGFDTDGLTCYLKGRCKGKEGVVPCAGMCGYRLAVPSICFLVARWGAWPPWLPITLRAMASNEDIRFVLMGDVAPIDAKALPSNVIFSEWPMRRLLIRLRRAVGLKANRLESNNHSTSKVSDLKPLFGAAFPELLHGCEWWGTMQDDVLPGRLRDWLTPGLLAAHDVVSPLPAPFASCGPFMLYRNVESVNRLYRASTDLPRVLSDTKYLAFDEWWGPLRGKQHMGFVTNAAAAAGRVRLYNGGRDLRKKGNKKAWGWVRPRLQRPARPNPASAPCDSPASNGRRRRIDCTIARALRATTRRWCSRGGRACCGKGWAARPSRLRVRRPTRTGRALASASPSRT